MLGQDAVPRSPPLHDPGLGQHSAVSRERTDAKTDGELAVLVLELLEFVAAILPECAERDLDAMAVDEAAGFRVPRADPVEILGGPPTCPEGACRRSSPPPESPDSGFFGSCRPIIRIAPAAAVIR